MVKQCISFPFCLDYFNDTGYGGPDPQVAVARRSSIQVLLNILEERFPDMILYLPLGVVYFSYKENSWGFSFMLLLDRSLFQLHRHFESNSDDLAFLVHQATLIANQVYFRHADSCTCLSSLLPISSLAWIPRPSLQPFAS